MKLCTVSDEELLAQQPASGLLSAIIYCTETEQGIFPLGYLPILSLVF